MKNRKRSRMLLVLLTILVMVPVMAGTVAAMSVNSDRTGSFTLTLYESTDDGSKKPIPNIKLKLYKVGELQTEGEIHFVLAGELEDTGVDLGKLDTAGAFADAAETLEKAVGDSGIEPLKRTTDDKGIAVFEALSQGMYLIVHDEMDSRVQVAPMLLSIPYEMEDGQWIYDISMFPKTIVKDPTPTPGIDPDPTGVPTPTPYPDVSLTPTPDPDTSPTPTSYPDASPTPTPYPDASLTPTPDPDVSPTPTITPGPGTPPPLTAIPTRPGGYEPDISGGGKGPDGSDNDINDKTPDYQASEAATSVKTGDESQVVLYLLLLGAAINCTIFLLTRRIITKNCKRS